MKLLKFFAKILTLFPLKEGEFQEAILNEEGRLME
jgi:hypothetical protein